MSFHPEFKCTNGECGLLLLRETTEGSDWAVSATEASKDRMRQLNNVTLCPQNISFRASAPHQPKGSDAGTQGGQTLDVPAPFSLSGGEESPPGSYPVIP